MIDIRNVTKRYGDLIALDDVSLHIDEGEVFGLIGPNGAGKTTTLKILATLLKPTKGDVAVAGFDLKGQAESIRRVTGYMPDFAGVYEDMQVDEYLLFFAAAAGIEGKNARGIVRDVLELTDLTHRRDDLVESLSRGLCQRLQVARVLLHDPKILLLDEPASGLSPPARVEMRMLLKELRAMRKTIIVSSHILPELEDICSSVGVIEQGKLVFHGSIGALIQRVRRSRVIHLRVGGTLPPPPGPATPDSDADGSAEADGTSEAPPPAALHPETLRAQALLQRDGRIEKVELLGNTIVALLMAGVTDPSFIPAALVAEGFHLHHFTEERLTLEDAFMRLTREGQNAQALGADTPA